MNATPQQFKNQAPKGPISRLLTWSVIQLVALVDWRQVPLAEAHLGGAEGVKFGMNSVRVADHIYFLSDETPAALGEIGCNTTTGRLRAYIGGASRDIPGSHEVLALSGGTLSGNVAMGTNKITGLGNGSAGSQDAATVSQVETYVATRIATQANIGYHGGPGFVGHGSITEINALSPVKGDIVVAENSGTPSAGTSDALSAGDVAEYTGTSWAKKISNSGGFVPSGTRLVVATTSTFITGGGLASSTDEGKIASFDGTSLSPASFYTPTDGVIVMIAGENAQDENKLLNFDGVVPTGTWNIAGGASTAHADLTGLTSGDDHTQYALLAGRSGGQSYVGGSGASDNLTLESTSNGTKGNVRIASGTKLVAMGDDLWAPATSGQGSLGNSSKKWGAAYIADLHTGDLNMAHPDGDPNKAWRLVETETGLEAHNKGTGQIHEAVFVRRGSVAARLLHLLG